MNKFDRAFIFFLLAGVLFHPPDSLARQSNGKLKGIVVDLQYARVTNATIIFEAASFKKYVQTDEDWGL